MTHSKYLFKTSRFVKTGIFLLPAFLFHLEGESQRRERPGGMIRQNNTQQTAPRRESMAPVRAPQQAPQSRPFTQRQQTPVGQPPREQTRDVRLARPQTGTTGSSTVPLKRRFTQESVTPTPNAAPQQQSPVVSPQQENVNTAPRRNPLRPGNSVRQNNTVPNEAPSVNSQGGGPSTALRPGGSERRQPVYSPTNPSWRYYNMPRRNTYVRYVPSGYHNIYFGGYNYRYYDGIFYRSYRNRFITVAPPIGIYISHLPFGYRKIFVSNRPYYYYYGSYYDYRDNYYYVVSPPVGAVVESLPEGYKTIVIDGETYYEADGAQYKPVLQENGEIWYEVIRANN